MSTSRGRPPSLTSASTEVAYVLRLVRAGNHVATACDVAGVPRATFYRALAREPELQAQLEQARAQAEVALVAVLAGEARQRDWRAAARFLELAFPERWARRSRYASGA